MIAYTHRYIGTYITLNAFLHRACITSFDKLKNVCATVTDITRVTLKAFHIKL